jgi:hypothetical protein
VYPGHRDYDYLEWIGRLTSHIPDRGTHLVHYYGAYSNAHRGIARRREVFIGIPPEDELPGGRTFPIHPFRQVGLTAETRRTDRFSGLPTNPGKKEMPILDSSQMDFLLFQESGECLIHISYVVPQPVAQEGANGFA